MKVKDERLERAITGFKGIENILVPLLKKENYEGLGEQDVKEFKEDIKLGIEALEKQIINQHLKVLRWQKCTRKNGTEYGN